MTTSPAQRLMGRRTKTLLPTTQTLLIPKATQSDIVKSQLKESQQSQAKYYNRNARDLPELSKGDTVRMKALKLGDKSSQKALVTARLDERSYEVETESGAVYRRNRQHLRKTPESPIQPTGSGHVSDLSSPNSVMLSTPISTVQPPDQPSVSSTDEGAMRTMFAREKRSFLTKRPVPFVTVRILRQFLFQSFVEPRTLASVLF